jgi:hypothetical protein
MQLLEPAAEDSLCTWNYFDEQLRVAGDFPVARLAAPQPMLVAELAPPDEKKPRKPITFETLYGRNPPSFSGSPASGFQ